MLAIPALVMSLGAAAPAPAAPTFPIEKYTLPNGLEVILVEDHKLPLVAVNIWYHVGPANEAPGLTGFAHLFEHMMFAATRHAPRGLVDQLFEGAGATDSNGSTDFDRTNYYDTLPSNQLELALWAHADRMGYLLDVLDQKALSNQQDVVRNERRDSVENAPYGIVEEALYQNLFPKTHPYHANVMGSHADIQSASLKDVRDFFTRYYAPNNASLVIAGDIDKAAARALVARYFGTFRRGADVAKPIVTTPALTREKRVVVHDRVELPRVIMGWLTTPAYQPGDADLTVAAYVLAGGKSSRLYKSLVYDKQLAQDVSADQNGHAISSVFEVDVTARPGRTAQEIEQAIDAELDALRKNGPTQKEVERAQYAIEAALLSSVEKLGGDGLADMVNEYNHYVGDPNYFSRDLERYRAVTPASVQRVMAEQLRKDARVVIHGLPGTPLLAPEVPVTRPKGRQPKAQGINADEPWRHRVPKPGPAPTITLPKATSFKLANGLTVIHHHNPALPLVAAELVVKAGASANPAAIPGLASFTASMLDEGTATRSAPQISDELAQLGAELSAGSGAENSLVSLHALKRNFARAFELMADVVLHPAFPEAEVERQRASRLADLAQVEEDAAAVANRMAAAALYGRQHPFGFGALGTEAAIKATTRSQMADFWQQHYLPNNAALVIAGDLTQEEALAMAQARFGAWKSGPVQAPSLPPPQTTGAGAVVVHKDDASQTALQVTLLGASRASDDYAALEVMNAALGGLFTSRINTSLREEKGYSYGVYSQFDYRRTPGPFDIAGSVRTSATGASVAEIFKQVKAIRDEPLPAAELETARNAQVLSLPGHFETNEGIGASFAGLFAFDLPLDYYATLAGKYAAVTAQQVQDVARRYLKPEKLIVVAVGDRKKIEPQLRKLKLGTIELRTPDGGQR
ncbi:insulinase family protein [Massilia sp. PAMC28688]|nr:insulinase family protein [Massilia sp. PAMC28688]